MDIVVFLVTVRLRTLHLLQIMAYKPREIMLQLRCIKPKAELLLFNRKTQFDILKIIVTFAKIKLFIEAKTHKVL